MASAWARGAEKLSIAPRLVAIEPTNLCNYRCSFCPQSDPRHQELPKGFMSLEHLDTILDKVIEAGAAWTGRVAFTHDGEPTLHPQFDRFIAAAHARGLWPRFSSNASKLTPELAERLLRAGGFTVKVDFSADADIFEAYRGRKGHWSLVREHLAHLIRLSNQEPRVRVEIFEMGGYARPNDATTLLAQLQTLLPAPTSRRVEFNTVTFHNAAGTSPSSAPPVALSIKGSPLQAPPPPDAPPDAPPEAPPGPAPTARYRRCPYPWTSLAIAWNGDVHACGRDLAGRTRLGNVLEAPTLWDVWNGEAFQQFRRLVAARRTDELGACRGCDMPRSGGTSKWGAGNIVRSLRRL